MMLSPSAEKRFWKKVRTSDGCWEWIGATGAGGYGCMRAGGGRKTTAHRVAWLLLRGLIPVGLEVIHRCDNRTCVRPSHLALATHAENMADMRAKGRDRHPSGPAQSEATRRAWITRRAKMATGAASPLEAPMTERTITTVCAGWKRADGSLVHTDVRVLTPGDSALPVSHGACAECARVIEAWGTDRKAVTA